MWQMTLMVGALVCLSHIHRLISLSEPKVSLLRKRIKIYYMLSSFLGCFRQAPMRNFWRQVPKYIFFFIYLTIYYRSFLTFHSLGSLVMHVFWGIGFDSSECFSNILQAWNCRFYWSAAKCDEWWGDNVCHQRLYESVCGVQFLN